MWIIFPRFDSNNFLEIVLEILKINTNFISYESRQKATIYIMCQITECWSSVTPKSGPVIKKFNTTKEPLIEWYGRSIHRITSWISSSLSCVNKFTYRAISYGNKKETPIICYSSDISDIMAAVKERYM